MKTEPIKQGSISVMIPSIIKHAAELSEAMPRTFTLPAPKGFVTGLAQYYITAQEQNSRIVARALPTAVKEGIATKSAAGFGIGLLAGGLKHSITHLSADLRERSDSARIASESGKITITNPLSFYTPQDTRDAVSHIVTELLNDNPSYQVTQGIRFSK